MTDKKKPKKEKAGYDIEIIRRATVDDEYNFYEFKAKIDPSKIDGMTAVRDIEKIVTFVRALIATEKPKKESEVPTKIKELRKERATKKKAAKIPTKTGSTPIRKIKRYKVPGYKEVGDTEDIKIADLKHGDKVNISVRLVEAIDFQEDIKSFISKADGSAGRYVKFDVADDSGTMKLTLFGDQVDEIKGVKANAWLTLENAYCKDYKGKLELSIAYGKMEVGYNG